MDEERSEAAWGALVSAALMGTERAPFTPPIAAGDLGAALAAIDPSNAERALLDSVALLAAYRRAGALPLRADATPPSASAQDALPPASERAANALEMALRGSAPHVLVNEWCGLAAQAGVRIPDQHLPAILDLVARAPGSHFGAVVDSLGPRGRWLAAYNPAWQLLALEPGNEGNAWATGDRATRFFALQMARRRDPNAGLALLESTWKTESADDRARFLSELGRGLSMADEPFLESALDDRAKGVRVAAAALLSQIGESRLVARMIDRLLPLLSFHAASGRLQVTLPEVCDAGMQRDGVEPKPPSAETGEKTWWFVQMLRCVPPNTWIAGCGAPAQALIDAAARSIWKPPLLDGWTEAAVRHADANWLQRLPETCFNDVQRGRLVVGWLPPAMLESLITRLLQVNSPLSADHPIFGILQHRFPALTPTQTRHALVRLRHTTEKAAHDQVSGMAPGDVRTAVASVVAALSPSAVHEAEAAIGVQEGDFSRWGATTRDALQVLYQRREIHAAFGKL